MKILYDKDIDRAEWSRLVQSSTTGTWFQTPEAFDFFASQPDLFIPFVAAVIGDSAETQTPTVHLRGIAVGYVTVEKNALKQFFTRRAIIIGGPALADDCTDEEVTALLSNLCSRLSTDSNAPIYIETRNFNDYSKWRAAFEAAEFEYQPHLNFHVHTNQPWEAVEANIGKHRRKYIRLSFRDGATVKELMNEEINELENIKMLKDYYAILQDLYKTKVKMPLQPWSFFERLYHLDSCKYLLVMYEGQVIGGSICMLLPGHGVYEWYACGKDGEYKNIHPSSVTKYAGMKYAADNGYMVFDMMGAGKPDEEYGVRDFKAEFGGELVEYGRFLAVIKPLLYKIGVLGVNVLKKLK